MSVSYGENRMILPTERYMGERDRLRRVVFYGRVSSEHEAQISALGNQLQWYDDQARYMKMKHHLRDMAILKEMREWMLLKKLMNI